VKGLNLQGVVFKFFIGLPHDFPITGILYIYTFLQINTDCIFILFKFYLRLTWDLSKFDKDLEEAMEHYKKLVTLKPHDNLIKLLDTRHVILYHEQLLMIFLPTLDTEKTRS